MVFHSNSFKHFAYFEATATLAQERFFRRKYRLPGTLIAPDDYIKTNSIHQFDFGVAEPELKSTVRGNRHSRQGTPSHWKSLTTSYSFTALSSLRDHFVELAMLLGDKNRTI